MRLSSPLLFFSSFSSFGNSFYFIHTIFVHSRVIRSGEKAGQFEMSNRGSSSSLHRLDPCLPKQDEEDALRRDQNPDGIIKRPCSERPPPVDSMGA